MKYQQYIMKNKKKRRRKTRKKRKGAGIKVYPGCMKFKNIIKRLEKENEELRKKVLRAEQTSVRQRWMGTPGAVGDPHRRRSERITRNIFGSPLSPGIRSPPRVPRNSKRILQFGGGRRSKRRRRRRRRKSRRGGAHRRRRRRRKTRRKQRGGFGLPGMDSLPSAGGLPNMGGLTKAIKGAASKLGLGDFPEGDSDAPGVPELPQFFGDALEKGLKFVGKPGIPTSDRNLDVKGSEAPKLPKTVFSGKLDPPTWSEDLRANFRNFDKFINNDTQILFEKK